MERGPAQANGRGKDAESFVAVKARQGEGLPRSDRKIVERKDYGMNQKEEEPTRGDTPSSHPTSMKRNKLIYIP